MSAKDEITRLGLGTSVIIFGFLAGSLLEYVIKIVLTQYLGPEDYGVFVQLIAVVQLGAVIGLLGLQKSLPRFISFYKGKERPEKVDGSVFTSLVLGTGGSLAITAALFLLAKPISSNIFHEAAMVQPLKLLSLAILPLSIYYLGISILRGLQDTRYKVLITDLLMPGFELGLILAFFWIGYGLTGVLYAYTASVLVGVLGSYYAIRKISSISLEEPDLVSRELLWFAWPLMVISVANTVNKYLDVLMLGWLTESAKVGIYEISMAVAGFQLVFLSSLNYLFMPVVSELYGRDQKERVRRLYITATRWIVMASLPFVAGFLIFPQEILQLLFGSEFTGFSALRILSVGYFYSVAVGPAGMILLSSGRTRTFMYCILSLTAVDALLNYLLIPHFGIAGAAFAMFSGLLVSNTLLFITAKGELDLSGKDLFFWKPLLAMLAVGSPFYVAKIIFSPTVAESVAMGIVLSSIYLCICYIYVFSEEDRKILTRIIARVNAE